MGAATMGSGDLRSGSVTRNSFVAVSSHILPDSTPLPAMAGKPDTRGRLSGPAMAPSGTLNTLQAEV